MNAEKICIAIKILRKRKGLTQHQLADKLGVTDKAVSKWERGLGTPDISMLNKLALILDIDTDNLRGILAHQLEVFSDIIQSDDMKIAIKNTTGGNPVLIIALPIYTGDERSAVAVTITATEDGGIQYNYEKIDDSLLAKI